MTEQDFIEKSHPCVPKLSEEISSASPSSETASERSVALSLPQTAIKFGTDGWRAVLGEDFTFCNVRRVAWALSQWLIKNAPGVPILVGFDRRFGSGRFAEEAAQVLAGAGIETRLSGDILPTPTFSYLAKKYHAYGLVVTASHNPPLHNGLKIKTPNGASAPVHLTREVENLILRTPEEIPKVRCLPDKTFRKDYVNYLAGLARDVRPKLGRRKIVVDYLHGSGAGFLEEVLSPNSLIILRKERDPEFGGVAPEPIEKNLSELKKTVKKTKAFMGVALDGDGDRLSLIDEEGNYIAPTTVFPMYAYYFALHRKEKGEVVQGVSLGYLGERVAQRAGLPFSWVPVGFKNIAERMLSTNVLIGGEESGGYALGRMLPDRDGSVNTLLMLKVLLELKTTPRGLIRRIFKELGASHYERFDVHLRETVDPDNLRQAATRELLPEIARQGFPSTKQVTIDGLKVFFEDGSWILLRPSGTEPLVRVYAETPTQKSTRQLINLISQWVKEKVKGI